MGGTGFIGSAVVGEALERGFEVRALARSEASAAALTAAGAKPVRGSVEETGWIGEARGADVLIDLVQPTLPKRLSRSAIRKVAEQRAAATTAELAALGSLPEAERPVYFSISGADDLEPDAMGVISHDSAIASGESGFAMIGVPVRRLVEASKLDAVFVNFGNLVYGPGKVFADLYVDGLRKGKAAVIGSGENRLPLTHVDDAAAALVHLAGLPRAQLAGRTFLAIDGSDCTQGELVDRTAELMGAKKPRRVPGFLAGLVGGPVAVETMTFDAHADSSALTGTGFEFRYPSPREGLPPALEKMGELAPAARGG